MADGFLASAGTFTFLFFALGGTKYAPFSSNGAHARAEPLRISASPTPLPRRSLEPLARDKEATLLRLPTRRVVRLQRSSNHETGLTFATRFNAASHALPSPRSIRQSSTSPVLLASRFLSRSGSCAPNVLPAFFALLTVQRIHSFRVSGGLFNPAVTLGMGIIGAITWLRVALLVAAQLLGAICAAAVLHALTPGSALPLQVMPPFHTDSRPLAGPLNAQTRLSPGMSIARGLFLEMFLTALLCLAIFFLAAEKHRGTFMAPVGIGLALWITQMLGGESAELLAHKAKLRLLECRAVYYTGASVNVRRVPLSPEQKD